MATSRGGPAVRELMAQLPGQVAEKVLRGAARAAANVVADEAKDRVTSEAVREGLAVKVTADASRVVAKVFVKPGWARSVGNWLEHGTTPHLISVDAAQRGGRSVGRINRLAKDAGSNHSLVIGGQFVGDTVLHPGARPHPFLRVALDLRHAEAVAAAQSYIDSRVTPAGITGSDDAGSEDA